ncbi:MAG TPA: head decoration protein [Rhodopila sp.]|nr:head decoration protein [Rhodopila sp.]
MTLTVNPIGDNPQTPGIYAETYLPDQLIAGRFPLVTGNVTLGAGTLQRGAVLGQVTATGNYILSVATAADGSQTPKAILADYADASGGAVTAPVYLTGEFNANKLVFDASWTIATLTPVLRALSMFVKTSVNATDPT